MPRPEARVGFRPLTEADLPLLAGWLAEPHWREWWGEPAAELAEIRGHLESISVEPLVIELAGEPIGYAQVYDPHLEDEHPYADQPFGTLGIDLSIGPAALVGIGHGAAALRQLADTLLAEGTPRLVIDPHPKNTRAIRAYEKAGFAALGPRNSIYGEVLLMALNNPDEG